MGRKERRAAKSVQKKAAREEPFMEFAFGPAFLHAAGPVIETFICTTEAHRAQLAAQGLPAPNPVRCRFLIDTGADGTTVKHNIAEAAGLKLLATGVPIHGVGIDTSGRTYLGRILFVTQSRLHSGVRHETWVDTEITSAALNTDAIDGLIGRDVLQYFDLRYNGKTGIVTLRYLKRD